MKKIVRGNDFTLRIPVKKIVNGEQVAFPLPACTDIVVNIVNQYRRVNLAYSIDTAEDNIINARVEGDAVSVGTYALEVRGKIFGNDWRSKEYEQFAIVDNNASGDTAFNGELIEGEDSVEMNTALVILPPTAELTQLINNANTAIETAKQTDATLKANESERTEAEQQRASAEAARVSAENRRSESEKARHAAEVERIRKETAREAAESARHAAEAERVTAEKERTSSVAAATSSCASAAKKANDAATMAMTAGEKATAMAAEAEKVNVTLGGSVISVTNRDGVTKTVDVVNTDEKVNVTITSSVSSIKVSGVKINVFINNGKTPQTYTTNSEGKVSFVVNRGNYYQITFTEYGNAQPIAPVGFTAVLATRNIDVEYKPYDEESMENVVVTVTKYTDGKGAAYEGVPVVVTVDRKNTTYNADAKGQVSLYVPYGKEFTVNVENQDGYSVSLNRNTRTYTASVPQRLIDYKMYQFRAGIFVIDDNLNEYYLEEWQAAGKTAEEAVAIKVASATLTLNRGTFMIRISDMLAPTALPKKSWCTQDLQFDSIALNGSNTKDANYYNGESSSFLVRQEAVERSLSVPAFDCAYEQIFSIAGHELHGFLMSIGQDYVHIANIGIIKQVLTALYGEEVANAYYNFVMKQYRWTSTQGSAARAWNCSSSANSIYTKSSSVYVLPVFAC